MAAGDKSNWVLALEIFNVLEHPDTPTAIAEGIRSAFSGRQPTCLEIETYLDMFLVQEDVGMEVAA